MTAMDLVDDFTDVGLGALDAAVTLFAQRRQEAMMIDQYNRLVAEYNSLLDKYRRLARRHNRLVDDHDRLARENEQYRRRVQVWLTDWMKHRE